MAILKRFSRAVYQFMLDYAEHRARYAMKFGRGFY